MTDATFIDFCKYIVSKKDSEDYDPDALLDFYLNFMEPYAVEKGIDLPEDIVELIDVLYETLEVVEESEAGDSEAGDSEDEESDA